MLRLIYHFYLGLLAIILLLNPAYGSEKSSSWEALKAGQAIAIMRHAIAPGFGDPVGFDVTNCATQRNLSAAGRRQAKKIGDIFRAQGISQARVISSEWCRCQDTAELLQLGKPTIDPMLNSFFQNRGSAQSQTQSLKGAVYGWLNKANNGSGDTPVRVLVTHQVNVSGLTGRGTGSGDIQIIGLDDQGAITVLEQITAPDVY